ncbi:MULTISPECIES: YtzC family protein [unclassified Bacillus (in: firmicutes)]|uniref:YtzC family protein n=1 Tax=unclassified Bacillus (in: firmicutes) TaxID=185979 RepID=UPI00211D7C7C
MGITDRAFGQDQVQKAKEAYDYAVAQLEIGMRQEHYNDIEYSQAQAGIEEALMELEKVANLANAENKDEFYRLRRQLTQLQHQMIITPH